MSQPVRTRVQFTIAQTRAFKNDGSTFRMVCRLPLEKLMNRRRWRSLSRARPVSPMLVGFFGRAVCNRAAPLNEQQVSFTLGEQRQPVEPLRRTGGYSF